MKKLFYWAGMALVAALLPFSSRTADSAAPATIASTPAPAPIPALEAVAQAPMVVRGFSVQLNDPKNTQAYLKAVDDMADMGCNWVNFVLSARQDDIHSEAIKLKWQDQILARADCIKIMEHAKARGMHTMFMPIVLIEKPGPKDWRGIIAPPSWEKWFASYQVYITTCAQMAKECNVDIFCVGSELLSTESKQEYWYRTIDEIKKIYKGKLTYSANWDHYTVPTFWDRLDFIGMNNYNKLADEPGATVAELVKKWQPIKEKVLNFGDKIHKPILFTEVGWHNLQNTIVEPWNYVSSDPIDESEQFHAYQAFVQVWKDVPKDKFVGAFIWEFRPGAKPSDHGSYSLQGSKSWDIVKQWMEDGVRAAKGS